jgi:multiple sugar transport system substrate-binding protein
MKKRFSLVLTFLLVAVVVFAWTTAWAAQQQTIKFSVWDYSMAPEYQAAINAFEKENPQIKVDVIDIAAKEYPDKMTVMLAAGEDVDAFAVKDFASYSNYIGRNSLTPLDSFVKKDKIDLKPYGGALNYVKDKGKLMVFPYRSDIYLLYYNKDIFDKAGIPYPSNDMTWQQYREIAKKITRGEGNDKTWGAYFHFWRSQAQIPLLLTTKTTLLDGKYSFLKPMYKLILGMQNEDKSIMSYAEIKTSSANYRGIFESGKVGMEYMGTWLIGSLMTDKKAGKHNVNWGIAKAPHWPGVTPGSTITGITTLAINAKSSKKEAAWKLISFLGGEKGAKIFAKFGVFPALRTSAVLDIYTSTEGFPVNGKAALVTDKTTIEIPPSPYANVIDKTLQEEHELIMTGQKPLDQGLKDMEKRVKEAKED